MTSSETSLPTSVNMLLVGCTIKGTFSVIRCPLWWRHLVNAYGVTARCADWIISNLAPLYLAAYLPVLNPAVGSTWPACHDVYSAVLRVSCCTS